MSEKDNKNIESSAGGQSESISAPVSSFLDDVVKAEKSAASEAKDKKEPEDKKSKKEKRSPGAKAKGNAKQLRHGMMSTVLTIVFIAVVVLVNVIATILFERYPITIDLTKDNIYSISEETEEYVKQVDTDVLITVFSDETTFTSLSTYTKQAAEVLKKYSQFNDHISYRYVDIDSNPDIISEYSADSITQYDIIVETNPAEDIKRTRKVTLLDLVDFEDSFLEELNSYGMSLDTVLEYYCGGDELTLLYYYGGYVESSTAEQAFTSALMTVTDPNPVNVVFLTGRNESSELSYFRTLLEANGYNVSSINITSEEIPEDTSVAVIAAPQNDYMPDELRKVSEYMDNGGELGKQLIYCASLLQGNTPNLDEFLAEYGIEIGNGVVCETYSDYYYQYPYVTVTSNVSSNFDQDITSSSLTIINSFSRPVNLLFDEMNRVGTEAYILSTDNAYVADAQTYETLERGQQVYMAVASKAKFNDDGSANYSNVIAFGSVDTLSDTWLAYNQFQNREYVLSVLNGITHKTDGIVIAPKVIEGNVFDITEKQRNTLSTVFILVIPLAVLILGGVIWLRRKNR